MDNIFRFLCVTKTCELEGLNPYKLPKILYSKYFDQSSCKVYLFFLVCSYFILYVWKLFLFYSKIFPICTLVSKVEY